MKVVYCRWFSRRQNTQNIKPIHATPPIVEKRSSPNDHNSTAGSQPTTIHQIMLVLFTTSR